MNTLVVLGTSTAWLYSMALVLAPDLVPEIARHVYFEATAMIIGLINLGLALELKGRGRPSEAINRLIGLPAKTARMIREDKELDIVIEQVCCTTGCAAGPVNKFQWTVLMCTAVKPSGSRCGNGSFITGNRGECQSPLAIQGAGAL